MPRIYDPNTRQWVEAPTPANASAPGGLTLSGSTYVRNPSGNQTVRGNMESLLSGNSDFIRLNERGGQKYAASRGLQNSTLAAQAGRQAAIQSALPIASADAQILNSAASQNMDALNAMEALKMQQQSQVNVGNYGAQYNQLDSQIDHDRRLELMREQSRLDREGAREDREWRSGESRLDRDWRSGESGRDRDLTREGWDRDYGDRREERRWRSRESELDRGLSREEWRDRRESAREERDWMRENMNQEQRFGYFRDMMQMLGGTLFSDPSFWRDPTGASGFLEFFTGQFGGIWSRLFGNGGG